MKLCGCPQPAAARWIYADGVSGELCSIPVDMWLDLADDEPDLEPAALTWLT